MGVGADKVTAVITQDPAGRRRRALFGDGPREGEVGLGVRAEDTDDRLLGILQTTRKKIKMLKK